MNTRSYPGNLTANQTAVTVKTSISKAANNPLFIKALRLLTLTLFSGVIFSAIYAQPNISGYTYVGSHDASCYYISNSTSSWTTARSNATAAGGHLVTLTSAAEDNAVFAMLPNSSSTSYHIGLTDEDWEGEWKWVTGETFSYENWSPGEPNSWGGNEDHVMYYASTPGLWHDMNNWDIKAILELPGCSTGSSTGDIPNFSYSCGDNKRVDVLGSGTDCSATPNSIVNFSSANVYQTGVEVVYKNQYPGTTVTVFDENGAFYTLNEVDISGTSPNVYLYRGLITGSHSSFAHNSTTGDCASNNGFQSLVVYPFQNVTTNTASSGTFTAIRDYCGLESFSVPIPTGSADRNIIVTLPISELTTDGRFLTVNINAGGATASQTIYGPDNGCCLAILEIPVSNVPGNTSSVTVEIDTRGSSNPSGSGSCGQSYVVAGLVHVDVDCTIDPCSTCDIDDVNIGSLSITSDGCGVQTTQPTNLCGTIPLLGRWFYNDGSGVVWLTDWDANFDLTYYPSTADYHEYSICFTYGDCEEYNENPVIGLSGCVTPPAPNFSFSCDDDKTVSVLGSGTDCSATPNSIVSFSSAGVYQTVVEVVYKNQYPGSSIVVTDEGGASHILAEVDISGTSSSVYVYRGLITGSHSSFSHNSETGDCASNNGFQSLVAYPFQNGSVNQSSTGTFTTQSGYCDLRSFSIPIPSDVGPRNVVVSLPISELTTDSRFLTVNLEAGGVTGSTTIYGPDNGCCLAIVEVSLANVPGNVTSVNIEVDTRSSSNPGGGAAGCGQSWVIAGLVHANVDCANPCDNFTDGGTIGSDQMGCGASFDPDLLTNIASPSGGSGGTEFIWFFFEGENPPASGVNGATQITGATGATYDPGVITTKTHYRRCARRTGCTAYNGESNWVTITLNPIPNITTGPDVEICQGSNVTISASATSGSAPYTFIWDNALGTGADKTVSPTTTTTYGVTVTDANGCTNNTTITVTVNPNPVAAAGVDQSICTDSEASISASATEGTPGYTFIWNQGLGDGADKTVTPVTTTTYTVTVIDSKSCSDTDDVTIEVYPNVDNGGEIAASQSACGESYDPALLTSISDPSGTTANIEIIWLKSTTDCTPPTTLDDPDWEIITGANALTYDPPVITETTCFLRCSRAVGCTEYLGESNIVTIELNPNPTILVTNASCEPGNVVYTITVTTTNADMLTSDVGTVSGTAPNFTVSDIMVGTNANLTATNSTTTCDVMQMVTSPVCTCPGGIVSVTDDERCGPGEVTLTATVDSGAGCDEIRWYDAMTGGALVHTGASYTVYLNATTTFYAACWNATQECYTGDSRQAATATVNAVPVVTASPDVTICYGTNTTISATVSAGSGSGYTYAWSNGLGAGSSKIVSPTTTTTYTVTVTDSNNCTDTDVVTVTVDNSFTPGIIGADEVNCGGYDPAVITGTTPDGCNGGTPEYHWQTRLGTSGSYSTISGATSASYDPPPITETTQYRRKVRPAGSSSQWAISNTVTKTVNPVPTLTTSPDVTICHGASTTVSAIASGGSGSGYIYEWSNGLGTGSSKVVSPIVTTTYSVTVTDANDCTASTTVTVTVNPNPTVNAGDDATICPGGCTDLLAVAMGGSGTGFTFSWDNNLGNGAAKTVCPTATTIYTVTITDSNGCTSTDQVTVTVDLNACASLGDFVWEDKDADGQQDAGEPGISGVTVILLDENGNMLDQTTTNGVGFYEFTELQPGNYIVKFTAPGGFKPSPSNIGNDTTDSDANETTGQSPVVNLVAGENDPTIDAGFYQPASIGDFVFSDNDNDGQQDAGEPGISGVTVSLTDTAGNPVQDADGNPVGSTTTDGNGAYGFSNLVPGDYIVVFETPNLFDPSTPNQGDDASDSDADPTTGQSPVTNLESGENDPTIDAGFVPQEGSLGDFVWKDLDEDGIQDANEPGIGGVTVMLLDGLGNMITQTTTAADGSYSFTGLAPGNYIVKFTAPNGFVPSPVDAGGNDTVDSDADVTTGQSPVITLGANEDNPTIDAGFFAVCEAAATVSNAHICEGEQITVTASSVTGVAPFSYNWSTGQSTASFTAAPSSTTTYAVTITDANGCESSAQATVEVDPAILSGINGPASICANEGALFIADPAVVGATYLWTFTGPASVASSTDAEVTVLWSAVGDYEVTLTISRGLCTETYTHIINITESVFANPGDDAAVCRGGSVQIGLPAGQSAPMGATYEWSPNLFMDDNSAAQPTVSPPFDLEYTMTVTLNGCTRVESVMVNIDVNKNPIADAGADIEGCQDAEVVLGGNPTATPPPAEPGTTISSVAWTPAANLNDPSLENPTLTVTGNETYQVVVIASTGCTDTAYVDVTQVPCGSLGDFVWEDTNANGQQDAGEPGIGGVTVMLLDDNGNMLDQTTTAADGSYIFENLMAGNYIVKFTTPGGFESSPANQGSDTSDSDADQTTGQSPVITLAAGENNPTIDAGFYQPASIGDFVWEDTDQDGQQDAGEPGLEGVTVSLTDAAGNPVNDADGNPLADVTTTVDGAYQFTNLVPGNYIVVFQAPNGDLIPSPANQGDDATDSDANETTGKSPLVNLESGENDPTIDAGFYAVCEANISGNTHICEGEEATLIANSTLGQAPLSIYGIQAKQQLQSQLRRLKQQLIL